MSALVDELRRWERVLSSDDWSGKWLEAADRLESLCLDHHTAILRVLEAAEGVADGDRPENALLPAVAALREIRP